MDAGRQKKKKKFQDSNEDGNNSDTSRDDVRSTNKRGKMTRRIMIMRITTMTPRVQGEGKNSLM